MKNYLNLLFGLAIIAVFSLSSCGSDKECTSEIFTSDINVVIEEFNSAVATFNADNSSENCEALKDASEKWADEVADFSDCAGDLGQANYDAAGTAARAATNSITCN